MNFTELFDIKNLHHAYLIEGDRELVQPQLFSFIRDSLKHPVQGNPDFSYERIQSFSIEDARDLRERQEMKSFSDGRKIFVIDSNIITLEAQNALLKILEEPAPGTHFFFIIPLRELVVPTVRSRLMIVAHASASHSTESNEQNRNRAVQDFVTAPLSERLKIADAIAEEKDREAAIVLVDGVIRVLRAKKDALLSPQSVSILGKLVVLRGYLSDRSPSFKLILEEAALLLSLLQ